MADVRSSGDMPPASTLARAASVHSPSALVDDGDDPGVVVMHAARRTALFMLLLQAFTSCWQRARPSVLKPVDHVKGRRICSTGPSSRQNSRCGVATIWLATGPVARSAVQLAKCFEDRVDANGRF